MCSRSRLALAVALAATLLSDPLSAAGRAVSIRGSDGRTIAGLLFEANQRGAAAVVLLPMLGRPRDDWQYAGQRLADANITALAIDLREPSAPADGRALAAWHEDAIAAVSYLLARPEVRADAIGLAGASLGANLAAVAAAADPRVRSLALISPSLDYRGLRIEGAMRQYGDRPALLIASLKDPYAARSVRELARDAATREMRWSDTAAHGQLLLARDPDLVGALVQWFQRTLG